MVRGWWKGSPRERAFLQAVLAGACAEFYTVLGPGSDRHHYNHIHVDLLVSNARNGRHFCQPSPGRGVPVAEATSAPSTTASVKPFAFVGPVQGPIDRKAAHCGRIATFKPPETKYDRRIGRESHQESRERATAAKALGPGRLEGRDGSRIVGADA